MRGQAINWASETGKELEDYRGNPARCFAVIALVSLGLWAGIAGVVAAFV